MQLVFELSSGDITVGGLDSLLRLLDGISQDAAMLEFVKAQEDWEIDGGNAVEPRVVKRPIRTAIAVLKSNTASRGLYHFNQTNTKTDMSMRRKFDVSGLDFSCAHDQVSRLRTELIAYTPHGTRRQCTAKIFLWLPRHFKGLYDFIKDFLLCRKVYFCSEKFSFPVRFR